MTLHIDNKEMMTMHDLLNKEVWNHALYLHERPLSLQGNLNNFDKTDIWRKATGLEDDKTFHQRLEADQITIQEFQQILSMPLNSQKLFKDKEWYRILEAIFLVDNNSNNFSVLQMIDQTKIPFIEFMSPFLEYVIKQTLHYLKPVQSLLDKNYIEPILTSILKANIEGILKISGKCLIFELNKNRLMGTLVGADSHERYNYYINSSFSSKELVLEFLSTYPVLARLICEHIQRTTLFMSESIINFLNDYKEINEKIGIETKDIVEIEISGDSHNNGKGVIIYHFSNNQKLVYKPHSLSTDVAFQELLQWFNKKNINKHFDIVKLIDKEKYGWVEFISNKECKSITQVNHFYEQQGQYLAILYMLNATDIHFENIIAKGEHPIIIDLEALFHNNTIFTDTKTATNQALLNLNKSVMRTGLLPISIRNLNDLKLDVSGLGNQENQSMYAYKFTNLFTDEMKMEKTVISLKLKKNHPIYNGKRFSNTDKFDEFIKVGFYNTYNIIIDSMKELQQPEGIIYKFKNCVIRNIVRDTQTYSSMLEAGKHPKYLKDGLERGKLFDNLWRAAVRFPTLSKVIESEVKDLLNEDIPYFWSYPESPKVYDSRKKVISDFYQTDSFTQVLGNFAHFSTKDCEKQLEYIDYALSTVRKAHELTENRHYDEEVSPKLNLKLKNLYQKEDYLLEAIKIGKTLLKDAVWGENKENVTWVSLGINEYERVEYKPMELGLYDGLIGMALFYGYLGKESNDDLFTSVARACLNSVLEEYTDLSQRKVSSSAFLGYASIIYAVNHFYYLWKDESLLDLGKHIVNGLRNQIKDDRMYDFLGGSAGIITVALDFFKISGYKKSLELAEICGKHLIKNAIPTEQGIGWLQINRSKGKPLGGLAHGNSGIAYSLIKLYSFTQQESYKTCAFEAIKYDNSLLDNNKGNWIDLRNVENTGKVHSPLYWCNGAPGIGLSRLYALDYLSEEVLKADLELAVDKTKSSGFNKESHCLCHGDLGNIDFLLSTSIKTKNYPLMDEVYARVNMLFDGVKKENNIWKCGIPGSDKPTPNMFTGLAGIGYAMLRLYNNNLPSTLILESPEVVKEEK
ncbi:type 2 lanthipeptide synthetase LanM family protein [Priestia megaterium]|uniref:type 2 lanthipeptide synthetase LanM family protein n=2 Tax=Priestia TaxID=2800373 RepID=UPI000BA6BE5C|nr:type 2 lanthipeptide synthetase LanM family protein [Priestia megaterium]PAK44096.1 hypothetical protein CHH47_27325 [Priestia megaterium]